MAVNDSHRDLAPSASRRLGLDEDERLIAEASAPATLDEARETLTFWEKRLARLRFYERVERREAQDGVVRAKQRVRDAERASYGPSPMLQLIEAVGIRFPGRELVSVAKKAFILAAMLIVVLIVATIAYWSDIYPVLRDLSQLAGAGGDGGGGGGG